MTVGQDFPTLTPQGQLEWWVVNQQTGGPHQVLGTNYVIVSTTGSRPVNAVAGPFTSKTEAQAWQTSANTAGNSPGSAIGGAVNAATSSLNPLAPLFQSAIWLRVLEVVAGLVLLGIGVNALFKGKPLQIVTGTVGAAAKVVP